MCIRDSFDTSREFDIGDREEIILHFVHAAARAQEVGMDFIEIHGPAQHLLDQCFSLKFNNREDEFGPSSLEDRMRLPMENRSCNQTTGFHQPADQLSVFHS